MRCLYLTGIKPPYLTPISLIFLISFYFGTKAIAHNLQTDSSNNSILLQEWLTAGPIEINIPVFYEHKNIDGKTLKMSDLLRSGLKELAKPLKALSSC